MLRKTHVRSLQVVTVGKTFSITRKFDSDDVVKFAEVSGDRNDVHLDENAAKAAGFQTRLVHGMLVASLFSRIMGMHLPGPGSIYMQQSINFRAPVYVGDEVTASVTVSSFDTQRGNIHFDTRVVSTTGTIVIDGKALGRNRDCAFERVDADTGRVTHFEPVSMR